MIKIWIFLSLLIFGVVDCKNSLLMVVEVFNEGASTPKTNPFNYEYIEQFGRDNLLANGIRQQYVLGSKMAESYGQQGIFKDVNLVKMIAGDTSRMQESASSHYLGLVHQSLRSNLSNSENEYIFPPQQESFNLSDPLKDNKDNNAIVPWVEMTSAKVNDLFGQGVEYNCNKMKDMITDDKEYVEIVKEAQSNVTQIIGKDIDSIYPAETFFNSTLYNLTTLAEISTIAESYSQYEGEPLPGLNWDQMNLLRVLEGINFFSKTYYSREASKYWTDNLSKDMISHLEQWVKESEGGHRYKYVGYSSSQINLLIFMNKFGLLNKNCLENIFHSKNQAEVISNLT